MQPKCSIWLFTNFKVSQNGTLRVRERVMLWVFKDLIRELMIPSKFECICWNIKMVNIFHLQKWIVFLVVENYIVRVNYNTYVPQLQYTLGLKKNYTVQLLNLDQPSQIFNSLDVVQIFVVRIFFRSSTSDFQR